MELSIKELLELQEFYSKLMWDEDELDRLRKFVVGKCDEFNYEYFLNFVELIKLEWMNNHVSKQYKFISTHG